MQIAVLLFDHLTALDVVGPYEALSRVPGATTVFVGERRGPVRTDVGSLALTADATLAEVPAPDVVLVPGGWGQTRHMADGPLHEWLRAADAGSTWTTSVCTGALLLAAAGLLTGRRATTHWLATGQLADWGVEHVAERVVVDGKYVTAAGVSAGLDMGLLLAGLIAGEDTARAIQLGLEYDPQPPFAAGSPRTAPAPIVELVRSLEGSILRGE
ncbi:DJ-1/PfpI family protein [Geodermatophilus sp. CPCC 206100]|uniref:DJ-1/PfpI family protein n=1 Tax=Geodermatophilus sp. CPCC 206100 TaxID=3020054 RepID=UPI003B006FD5